jgi:YebC/PmpR family DNA-binding regulatory protein
MATPCYARPDSAEGMVAMGRIFETRKATMFARWNKMSKAFTRISKDIVIAVKSGGTDPNSNPALRRQIQNARAVNMPKDKIENAIKRAQGKDAANYEEVIYEGYAPHGIPVIVVTATDNPTRTFTNVRTCFGKAGGNLGTTGSVAFAFTRMGVFRLDPTTVKDAETLELELIDAGLEEMGDGTGEKGEPQIVIRCSMQSFGSMQSALEARGVDVVSAALEFIPTTPQELPEDKATEVLEMVDKLEQDDDVQQVFHALG